MSAAFWDGGTFAVPMFEVPPHGTMTLEPKKLAAAGTRDAAGRTLDPGGANLALKWLVRTGSHELLGRTESMLVGQSDGFGFNCGGCCWSEPRLEFNPWDEIELGIGDYPIWEPWTYFDTCTGQVGPYFSNVIDSGIPTPFSWDFVNLSTSAGADDDIGFQAEEEAATHMGCFISLKRIWKWGRGRACNRVYNPNNYNPSVACVNQTSNCQACLTCCSHLYSLAVCKGGSPALAQSEKNACDANCTTDLC